MSEVTQARKARINDGSVRRVRRVSVMGKARRHEGAQGVQFSRLELNYKLLNQ